LRLDLRKDEFMTPSNLAIGERIGSARRAPLVAALVLAALVATACGGPVYRVKPSLLHRASWPG